jgi:hypothetical protein
LVRRRSYWESVGSLSGSLYSKVGTIAHMSSIRTRTPSAYIVNRE